jgi:hypothetical protein
VFTKAGKVLFSVKHFKFRSSPRDRERPYRKAPSSGAMGLGQARHPICANVFLIFGST